MWTHHWESVCQALRWARSILEALALAGEGWASCATQASSQGDYGAGRAARVCNAATLTTAFLQFLPCASRSRTKLLLHWLPNFHFFFQAPEARPNLLSWGLTPCRTVVSPCRGWPGILHSSHNYACSHTAAPPRETWRVRLQPEIRIPRAWAFCI